MPLVHRSMTPLEWALLLTLSLLWGGSYLYVGIAVKALPPFTIVAFRVIVGALLLHLVIRASGLRMPAGREAWTAFFVMGLLNNVIPFSLITWGQGHVPSGLASILNATTPLFGVVVAHLATADERMTPVRLAGAAIGFSGVAVMIGLDAFAGAGGDIIAEIALLLASVFYAVSGVYGRRFARMGLQPMATATGQITASAIMMAPIALIIDQPWSLPVPGPAVWASLIGLAALSTTLAYVIFYRILATAGAVNLLLVTFLVPVSAILLGALFLAERLSPNHFLGMALIGVGLAAIDGRPLRRLARRRPT